MNPMNRQTNLRWDLIVLLALLGLVRPLLSITGVYGSLGGAVLVTILVAAVWVCVVFVTRATNPLLTLVAAGGLYGAFAILLQQIIWNLFLGGAPEGIPSSAPVLVMSWVSILVTNTILGAFVGLVAMGLHRLLPRREELLADIVPLIESHGYEIGSLRAALSSLLRRPRPPA